jgi:peptidoglycan/LPS O-acetylase OafA/YrhL
MTARLIFANQLRGFAALFVAGSHLVGAFWAMRDFVGLATATPAQGGDPPPIFGLFSHTWLNFGPLGVGVFFLISGLVIPFSLERHTRGSFLLARVLRIYPTYVAALLLEMAVVYAASKYWGRPFPYGSWTIASNALLIYNTVGQPSIDLVNWTLCVELKFYLLMLLLAPRIRRGSVTPLLGVAAIILAANIAVAWPPVAARIARPDLVETFSTESVFIVFMLLGVLCNFHLRGLLRLPGLAASAAAMLAMFLACWWHSAIRAQMPIVTVNYLYAVAGFAALYFLRRHARPIPVIDFLAAISFPLYLVHSLVGYTTLKFLMLRGGLPYLSALALTLAVVIGIATALHLTIERTSIRLGKTLARRPRDGDMAKLAPQHPSIA